MPLPPKANSNAEWWPVVAAEPTDVYHGVIFQKCTKSGRKKTSTRATEHLLVKALDPSLVTLIRRASSSPPHKRRRLELQAAPPTSGSKAQAPKEEDDGEHEDKEKLREEQMRGR